MSDDRQRNIWSYVELKTTDIVIEENIPFDQWEELGERLNAFIEVGRWGIGRWAEYGELNFGDDYTRAIPPSRSRRIDQALWVHRRVPPEIRHEKLSWSAHRAVAGLDDHELQRKLLDMAEVNDWEVSVLAKAVREAKKAGKLVENGEPAEIDSVNRLFGASGRVRTSEAAPAPAAASPSEAEAAPAPSAGFTPRVVAGKDVEGEWPDEPYNFLWEVVRTARDAIAKGEITDELRKAVADVDALEAIAARSVG